MTAAEILAAIEAVLERGFELLTGDITPEIEAAFRARGLEVAEKFKVSADVRGVVDRAAVEYAANHAGELIKDFAKSTPEMLRGTVSQAIEEGWSTGRLRDALRENYAFSPERALAIARTETAIARRRGGHISAKALGAEQKKWSIGGDNPCQDCLNNQAQGWIDIDDDFPESDDPHPNCTCDIEYRMKSEPEPSDELEDEAA